MTDYDPHAPVENGVFYEILNEIQRRFTEAEHKLEQQKYELEVQVEQLKWRIEKLEIK